MSDKFQEFCDLPLSQAVREAVNDLLVTAQDKRFKIDMGYYFYQPARKKRCLVCVAGSVLAQRHAITTNKYGCMDVSYDHKGNGRKMYAIDAVRRGELDHAIALWYGQDMPYLFGGEDEDTRQFMACPVAYVQRLLGYADQIEEMGY